MEPSSQDLPFILVYGAWIWKLALLALVARVFDRRRMMALLMAD